MNLLQKLFKRKDPALQQAGVSRCASCHRMKAKGSELIFVSCIKRDGSGTSDVSKEDMKHLNDTVFHLNSLSITNKTYIACEFNSYVVRLRNCG